MRAKLCDMAGRLYFRHLPLDEDAGVEALANRSIRGKNLINDASSIMVEDRKCLDAELGRV
jgi:hypothetical protein